MAVPNSNSRSRLKRFFLSLSLDAGLDTDQPGEESFNTAMSRKTRRKANKKAKDPF